MEWRWVRKVMEVGESSGCVIFFVLDIMGLGREEMRVQRGDKDSKKAD